MSELLFLRREVAALRKKAESARLLETQNALLHLSVAKAEQENLTLKRAVVILQRQLRELEHETVGKATLMSSCQADLARHASQESPGLSPSAGRSVSSGRSRLSGNSPVLTKASRDAALSPQLRRSSRSPSPPDIGFHRRHGLAVDPATVQHLLASRYPQQVQHQKQYRAPEAASSPMVMSLSPVNTNTIGSSSMLYTPPKKALHSSAKQVLTSSFSPTLSLSSQKSPSATRRRHQSAEVYRDTVHEAVAAFTGLADLNHMGTRRFQEGRGQLDNDSEGVGMIEVSAMSSLFSPLSNRQLQLHNNSLNNTATTVGGTPVSPRSVVPSPFPRAATTFVSPRHMNAREAGSSPPRSVSESLPSAPTRLAPSRPPPVPNSVDAHNNTSVPKRVLQRGRPLTRSSSPQSRSSSIASSNGGADHMSIDEELNEGIQRKLASLTFF